MSPLVPILSLLLAPPPQDWPKPDQRLDCGPLTLEVYVSRTAHVFHLVDQLSRWDNSCHGQYREHMSLTDEDEAVLARYAEVRSERRWGQGLEQTFYVPLSLSEAARAGERAKHVTEAELAVILPALERFAPRADVLLESNRAVLEHAFERVDRARLTQAAEQLAAFTGVKKLAVPVFPLASPVPGGGDMDGGRLRWELADENVSFSVLLHELTHGFFLQRNDELRRVVDETPGLSITLLGEGFAYAVAPGLYPDDGTGDNLAYNVAKDRAEGRCWQEEGPERCRAYALGLRPLLAQAFAEKQGLASFLPRARDVYLALSEVEGAAVEARGPPRLLVAGPAAGHVRARLLDSRYHMWIRCMDHSKEGYDEDVPGLRAGDLLVLLVQGDGPERVPPAYAWLSPASAAEVDRALREGTDLAAEHRPHGTFRVVLLAAPTAARLEAVARESPLLAE